jgi:hypothetical protein
MLVPARLPLEWHCLPRKPQLRIHKQHKRNRKRDDVCLRDWICVVGQCLPVHHKLRLDYQRSSKYRADDLQLRRRLHLEWDGLQHQYQLWLTEQHQRQLGYFELQLCWRL